MKGMPHHVNIRHAYQHFLEWGVRDHEKRISTSESIHQMGFFTWNSRYGHIASIASKLRLIVSSGRSVLTLVGPNEGPIAKPGYGLVFEEAA